MIKSLLCILIISSSIADRIVQVQIVYRHGARNQLSNIYDIGVPAEEYGELTPVGYHQHYLLGDWFRQRYILNETTKVIDGYHPYNVLVRSTDVNRTIMSAELNNLGLFPLGTGPYLPDLPNQVIVPPNNIDNSDIPSDKKSTPKLYQPVPIHVLSKSTDFLRGFDPQVCESSLNIISQNLKSQEYLQVESQASSQIAEMAQILNSSQEMNLNSLTEAFSVFISGKWNGNQIPQFSDDLWNQFWFLFNIEANFVKAKEKWQADLFTTPFFADLILRMNNRINSTSNQSLIINSAHDDTLIVLMNSLNMTSWKCQVQAWQNQTIDLPNCIYTYPGFASNIAFELWESDSKDYYVKLMHNGTYWPLCGKDQCSFAEFEQRISNQLSQNYSSLCLQPQQTFFHQIKVLKSGWSNIFIGTGVLIGTIFLGYQLNKKWKKQQRKTQNLLI